MIIFEGFEFWVLSISFEEIGKYNVKANMFFLNFTAKRLEKGF